jgi:hypothetical protein
VPTDVGSAMIAEEKHANRWKATLNAFDITLDLLRHHADSCCYPRLMIAATAEDGQGGEQAVEVGVAALEVTLG